MPSSGIHANGLSLRRSVLTDLDEQIGDQTVGDMLLEPTVIYVQAIRELLVSNVDVRGHAHITGDGFLNLLRLEEFTTNDRYRRRAVKAFEAFGGDLRANPGAMAEMLLALEFHLDLAKEILIVTPEGERDNAAPLMAEFRRAFLPNRILTVVEQGEALERHAARIPLLEDKRAMKNRPTAYVCEQGICELPTGDPEVFAEQIAKVEPLESDAGEGD
jgi:uncharacterized protein YyaL (SSP411 family)